MQLGRRRQLTQQSLRFNWRMGKVCRSGTTAKFSSSYTCRHHIPRRGEFLARTPPVSPNLKQNGRRAIKNEQALFIFRTDKFGEIFVVLHGGN